MQTPLVQRKHIGVLGIVVLLPVGPQYMRNTWPMQRHQYMLFRCLHAVGVFCRCTCNWNMLLDAFVWTKVHVLTSHRYGVCTEEDTSLIGMSEMYVDVASDEKAAWKILYIYVVKSAHGQVSISLNVCTVSIVVMPLCYNWRVD